MIDREILDGYVSIYTKVQYIPQPEGFSLPADGEQLETLRVERARILASELARSMTSPIQNSPTPIAMEFTIQRIAPAPKADLPDLPPR